MGRGDPGVGFDCSGLVQAAYEAAGVRLPRVAQDQYDASARGFDGYKGHVAIDPDSEIITETVVTAGNHGDASAAEALVTDLTGKGPR